MNQQMMSFQIIAKAGDAFAKQIEALERAKASEFSQAEELIESGKKDLSEAHQIQTDILVLEAQGQEIQVTPIMVHAQDHLTKAIMGELVVREQVELYKRLSLL